MQYQLADPNATQALAPRDQPLSARDLTTAACQVTRGMDYLAQKKVDLLLPDAILSALAKWSRVGALVCANTNRRYLSDSTKCPFVCLFNNAAIIISPLTSQHIAFSILKFSVDCFARQPLLSNCFAAIGQSSVDLTKDFLFRFCFDQACGVGKTLQQRPFQNFRLLIRAFENFRLPIPQSE